MSNFETSEIIRDPMLGDRLLELKNKNKYCDFKIIVGKKSIFVHKHILASSSPYFENLFNDESMTELTIKNMNLKMFQLLLEYCYTGNLRVSETNLHMIMLSAKTFKMTPVLNGCEKIFKLKMNSSNYIMTWKWAELKKLEDLRKIAVDYARQNYEKVSQLTEFLSLNDFDIIELLKSDIIVTNEMTVFNSVKNWIDSDISERIVHVYELSHYIKFQYLPGNILDDRFTSICYNDSSNECIQKILDAQKWKLEKSKSSDGNPRDSYSTIAVIGSQYYDKSIPMEIFDLKNEKWVTIEDFEWDLIMFSAALLENKLMLIGGRNYNGVPMNTVQSYDLSTGILENLPPMKFGRWGPSAVEFKGCLYAIGGRNGIIHIGSVEMWDPALKAWKELTAMSIPREGCEAAVLNEEIFVIGGSNKKHLSDVESYNPVTDKWRRCSSMSEKRHAPGVAVISGFLYVAGGWSEENVYLMTAEKYDPKIDKWTMIQSLEIAKCWLGAASLYGNFVTVGGAANGFQPMSTVEMYDDENNSWISLPSLNKPRYQLRALEIPWRLAEAVLLRQNPR